MVLLWLWMLGRKRWAAVLSTSYEGYTLSASLLMLTWITQLRSCWSGFSTVKLPPPNLSVLPSLEGIHFVQPMLEREIVLHLLEGRVLMSIIWNYSMWDIWFVPSLPIFIYLFISLWTYGYLLYTLLESKLFYLFRCSSFSNFDSWELCQFVPPSLWHSPILQV